MKLYTTREACEFLRWSRSTLFRQARIGAVKMVRIGKRSNRIEEGELRRIVAKGAR